MTETISMNIQKGVIFLNEFLMVSALLTERQMGMIEKQASLRIGIEHGNQLRDI